MAFNICSLIGHRWRYKDYTQAMRRDGSKYNFTATRLCSRCEKKQFLFADWVDEKMVPKTEIDAYGEGLRV